MFPFGAKGLFSRAFAVGSKGEQTSRRPLDAEICRSDGSCSALDCQLYFVVFL